MLNTKNFKNTYNLYLLKLKLPEISLISNLSYGVFKVWLFFFAQFILQGTRGRSVHLCFNDVRGCLKITLYLHDCKEGSVCKKGNECIRYESPQKSVKNYRLFRSTARHQRKADHRIVKKTVA